LNVIDGLPFDGTFPHHYEVAWLRDRLSSTALRTFYAPAGRVNSGPILRLTRPDGTRWLVVVRGTAAALRLFSWPDPSRLAVLADADNADLADTATPGGYETLRYGVNGVRPVMELGRMLLHDDHVVAAYDWRGVAWEHRTAMCGMKIVAADRELVRLEGSDFLTPGRSAHVTFDVRTGRPTG
jgi:hypothetical protein